MPEIEWFDLYSRKSPTILFPATAWKWKTGFFPSIGLAPSECLDDALISSMPLEDNLGFRLGLFLLDFLPAPRWRYRWWPKSTTSKRSILLYFLSQCVKELAGANTMESWNGNCYTFFAITCIIQTSWKMAADMVSILSFTLPFIGEAKKKKKAAKEFLITPHCYWVTTCNSSIVEQLLEVMKL